MFSKPEQQRHNLCHTYSASSHALNNDDDEVSLFPSGDPDDDAYKKQSVWKQKKTPQQQPRKADEWTRKLAKYARAR